ncbi:FtsB family cell division protein [Pikeienuella sp. HZG-20]|uniref:FtsB family cell division protein n=1 Tax=Paludibacillus litoralis TaxID=3133267 RepID=UPI0030EB441F
MIATRLKIRIVDICACLFVVAAVLHFGHRGVQGGLGLRVGLAAEQEESRLAAELDALVVERQRLENLTRRLDTSYLDLDLLDERARDVLGFIRPEEIVIR